MPFTRRRGPQLRCQSQHGQRADLLRRALVLAAAPAIVTWSGRTACSVSVQPRRFAALGGAAALSGLGVHSSPALEGSTVSLKQVISENGLEDWKLKDYEAMRDDGPRTSRFEAAIMRRLKGQEGQATVVDIGTGSFALLAVIAAKAGAKKVYAIEKNPDAAKQAKETVEKAGLQNMIQIIEGDSMKVDLPERVDFVVSELIGSIATQEGVEPIIRDAGQRFVKRKVEGGESMCSQMIPARCQTLIAPVKYTEHRIMSFAGKRGVMSRGKPEDGTLRPLRLRSKTRDLNFLAEPQILEDFDYCNPGPRQTERQMIFNIPKEVANEAKDFSGFAMWTKVVVDDVDSIDVKTQKVTSHWAYVVALMAPVPIPIAAPGSVQLTASIDYERSPVRYTLDAVALV